MSRRPLMPVLFVNVTLFSIGLGVVPAPAAEPAPASLVSKDLSTWQANPGEWKIVGQARMATDDPKRISAEPGDGVLINGPTGKTKNIFSKLEHADVEAHIEFMVPQGSNSGVYFQARYEVQILDSWEVEELKHGDCGGIYQRWADGRGFEGHPPKVNASRKPGQWQTFDVVFLAPRFDADGKKIANAKFVKVVHNGKVVHENVEVTGPTRAAAFSDEKPTGPLMLQGDHGPVAYRNIQIKPLRKQ
jgi:3-keto-disaccharide hydrolase